jgi:hypothetical protein
MGWIQVVRYSVTRDGERSTTTLVDVPPQLRDSSTPYLSFGVEPVLFDAPASTERDMSWRALSFLAYSPDALMTPRLEPVCGFSWGYDIHAGGVRVAALRACDRDDWSEARRALQARLPGWSFGGDDWNSVPLEVAPTDRA